MECTKCNIDKIEEEFPFKNKSQNRRSTVCKVCQREYKRLHYQNNKQAHYDRNKKTQDSIKQYILDYKDRGCHMCEETFKPCLEFHHLDSDEKESNVSTMYLNGSLNAVKKEIEKCVLLCANCHRKVHYDKDYNDKLLVSLRKQ